MENLKKTAYAVFGLIIAGLIIHVVETFYFNSIFGLMIAVFGFVVLLLVFGIHIKNKRAKKFEWDISHIGVISLIIIVLGISMNIVSSFIFPEHVGIGNGFMTLGFIVAVLGFLVVAIKEKVFK